MTPTPRLRRMRSDNFIPMKSTEYLLWKARQPDTRWLDRPYWRDTVEATAAEGAGGDEMDAGYLAAIRQAPRLVGTADGEVPMAVAVRLHKAGLICKQK